MFGQIRDWQRFKRLLLWEKPDAKTRDAQFKSVNYPKAIWKSLCIRMAKKSLEKTKKSNGIVPVLLLIIGLVLLVTLVRRGITAGNWPGPKKPDQP